VGDRYLVTGGAGFIGSHIVDRLIARGDDVVFIDDFNDYYDPAIKRSNVNSSAQAIEADFRDPAVWGAIDPSSIRALLHLGARAGVRPSIADPILYSTTNLDGTMLALNWATSRKDPVPVLFASSSSIYGDANQVPYREDGALVPISPYGATKAAAEILLQSYDRCFGVPGVALRFFTVYGPRQRPDLAIHKFARSIDSGESIPVFGDGSSSRDYTHVDDICAGVFSALERLLDGTLEHAVYNLGSDAPVRLDAMIDAVASAVGKVPTIDRQPMQQGDVKRTWADLTRAREGLDYAPTVSFEDGLTDFVRWMRA
jgi:UDP-glucuronate 4-epimerase